MMALKQTDLSINLLSLQSLRSPSYNPSNPMDAYARQSDFKLYPKRFLIVAMFALSQLMISVALNTLNPIAAFLTEIYEQSPVVVNLGGLLFVLMHPIFTFPASFVIDTYGTKVGIVIGCAFGIIGVSLRLLINQAFAWVIIGQVVAGIGRPFILNCQAKVAVNWFSAQKRGVVTHLLSLVLNISLVIGILIPGFVFKGYQPSLLNQQQGRQITFRLMWIQLVMAAICFLPNLFLQQSEPPTPPSESGSIKRDPFKIAFPKMMKNKNYLLLIIAFGCYFGIFNALSIVLSYLIEPWFHDDNLPLAVAAVGGSPVLSGIIGVMILGPIQRRQRKFKKWILICMSGSLLSIIFFYPLLQTGSLLLVSLISAINSFFLIPLVPIMLELGCELVFPVGEGSAVGMLLAVGNFAGFLLGLAMSEIVRGQSKAETLGGLMFCFGIFCLGILLIFFMKEEKNRQRAESKSSQLRKSSQRTTQHSQSLRESLVAQMQVDGHKGEESQQIQLLI